MPIRFFRSLKHALRGLVYTFRYEKNFRIEIIAGLVVAASLFLVDLATWERVALVGMVGWVIVMELLNTVVERVINIVRPRNHPYPGIIKDIMASVVLVSSLTALCVALIIAVTHISSRGI